ncbi:hypothetical protein H310_01035 [Aphanomyces invadans]|uniref:Uncharacterized protein n=1 Tax=Aphanomyces invadans TaxID=157072 RepID=A0A024UQL6_9STRA|nr:hypothetical protein H310_01035 [Aphanomyces invadans]ETW08455.1 hypothetical protein H310_01035 [Aphanomyces invadans]|eukprot:XP_008862260.1 hypothetical protein H310_01035 [Aphanomyces invadans]
MHTTRDHTPASNVIKSANDTKHDRFLEQHTPNAIMNDPTTPNTGLIIENASVILPWEPHVLARNSSNVAWLMPSTVENKRAALLPLSWLNVAQMPWFGSTTVLFGSLFRFTRTFELVV